MINKIEINGYDFIKYKIGDKEFKISVFRNGKMKFQFIVSLMPSGKEDVLSTYQLCDKSKIIPAWTIENLNLISDWISKETK